MHARLKRLEPNYQVLHFASILVTIMEEMSKKTDASKIVLEGFVEKVASVIQKGGRPLLDREVLDKINYRYFSEVLADVLTAMRDRGSIDGEVELMVEKLRENPAYGRVLLEYGLGVVDEAPVKVEREVLMHIVLTPLQNVLKSINQLNSKLETPTYVRSCLTCGRNYSLGVYRGGYRLMLCAACGHLARVDFFYCPSCGNTDPNSLRFTRFGEEPYFQLEFCDRCGAYYKMANEDVLGTVADKPFLFDMATIDFDNVANSARQKS